MQDLKKVNSKYDSVMTDNDIAKAIRKDLKEAGFNPKNGWKISIRQRQGGWSTAIYGRIVDAPVDRDSIEGQEALKTINSIHQAYNYDNSDIQTDYFDVRYYGRVQW